MGIYRGDTFAEHSGSAIHSTDIFLDPSKKIGIFVTANGENFPYFTMPLWIYDKVAGNGDFINPATFCQAKREAEYREVESRSSSSKRQQLDYEEYVGNYTHPSGATVSVTHDTGNILKINFGNVENLVEWESGDNFTVITGHPSLTLSGDLIQFTLGSWKPP